MREGPRNSPFFSLALGHHNNTPPLISPTLPFHRQTYVMIAINGLGAFFLNIVSFQANKVTSPLAVSIAAIAKQVLAIIVGIVVFKTTVTSISAFGVLVTAGGIIWYTRASVMYVWERRREEARCVS